MNGIKPIAGTYRTRYQLLETFTVLFNFMDIVVALLVQSRHGAITVLLVQRHVVRIAQLGNGSAMPIDKALLVDLSYVAITRLV